jgi:hypothetical protein
MASYRWLLMVSGYGEMFLGACVFFIMFGDNVLVCQYGFSLAGRFPKT